MGYLLALLPLRLSLMKFVLLLLAFISLTHHIKLSHEDFVVNEYIVVTHGTTDDWKRYTPRGVYAEVDYSDLGLEEPPYDIHTFLTCERGCWKLVGQSSIYKLSKTRFRVYLKNVDGDRISPRLLKEWKVVLNWEIKTMKPKN